MVYRLFNVLFSTVLFLSFFNLSHHIKSPVFAQTCSLKTQGDANCDNRIEIADFEIFRRELFGELSTKNADFNTSGTIDMIDFEIWRKGYFNKISPTVSITTAPTPTPTRSATVTPMPTMPQTGGAFPNFKGKYISSPNNGTPNPPNSSGIPLCPSDLHDPINWHPLYMPAELLTQELKNKLSSTGINSTVINTIAQIGCHYNHTHNANPSIADSVFGTTGSLWGGQTLSYPWETFTSSGHENHLKHEGYKYIVETNLPIGANNLNWSPSPNHHITDVRIQYHALGGPLDAVVRNHSYYVEYRVCSKNNTSQCGIMKFGGWADYGILQAPYKQAHIPLPVDPPGGSFDLNLDPYRAHKRMEDAIAIAQSSSSRCKTCGRVSSNPNDIWWLWTTSSRYGFNQFGGPFILVSDDWQGINTNNPTEVKLVCDPLTNPCRFNNSEHQPFTLWSYIPNSMDNSGTDTDSRTGFVSYQGYTDRQGRIVSGCSAPALDCVPLYIQGVPVGYGAWDNPTDNGKYLERFRDYDISPGNEWWIQYPN